jgi:GT2 family glycosyltransferase
MRSYDQTRPTIAVYDNSPLRQVSEVEQRQLGAYKHDPDNGGLAVAYNWALEKALLTGATWLLLLDQDSVLPQDFLESCLTHTKSYESDGRLVAIAPMARIGENLASPMRVTQWGLKKLSPLKSGIQTTEITAINSGVLLRCSFISQIGGFDQAYKLDLLDYWLFAQIYRHGSYAALSKAEIFHDLSSSRPHQYSIGRYRSILAGERQFFLLSKLQSNVLVYRLRLFCRAIKQLLRYRRPDLCLMTLRQMCH